MLYARPMFAQLRGELETKEIVVITGMRRVGKTTVLRYLYDQVQSGNKIILDLENPLNRKVFEEENYDAIWNNLQALGITHSTKAFIFIDEIQNLPQVSQVVKYLYDHWGVKFVLAGSSSFYLRNLFPESLAGRKVVFELFPLTFSEFLVFKNVPRTEAATFKAKAAHKNKIAFASLTGYYQEYMEFGGFPAVVLEENQDRKRLLLTDIFTSYFEKDAKNLADFKDMSKLRDLILLLAPRLASRVEILKLASELALSRETVYNYLAFLEQTYFITLLPRYSGSIDRQAAGSRKLFFCDSGLVNLLGRVSQGQLFEQSVYQNVQGGHQLAYYNKGGGHEIDFVVDGKYALEAKQTMSKQDSEILRQKCRPLNIPESYIVTEHFSDNEDAILAIDL